MVALQRNSHRTTRRTMLGLVSGGITASLLGAVGRSGAGAAAQGTATPAPATPAAAAPIVLVHGSFVASWCWEDVIPLLETAGRTVIAPDLPGHGEDQTPVPEITLQSYVDRIVEVVDAQTEPVLLVGHSMAGTVISQVAEQRPDKVRTLVYLAGYLLRDGETLLDAASADADSLLGPYLGIDEARGVAAVADDAIAPLFFHDCPPDVAGRAEERARQQAEPLAPFATPVRVSEANFGRVPRVYVRTLADRVVSPALQERLVAATPGGHVVAMATGHCPFLAKPEELASLLTIL